MINLDETIALVMNNPKFKKGLQFQKNLRYLTEVLLDLSDLTFVQN